MVRCGAVWCGLVQCGVAWCSVEWLGAVWYNVALCSVVWCDAMKYDYGGVCVSCCVALCYKTVYSPKKHLFTSQSSSSFSWRDTHYLYLPTVDENRPISIVLPRFFNEGHQSQYAVFVPWDIIRRPIKELEML